MNTISDMARQLGRLSGYKRLQERGRDFYRDMGKKSGEARRKRAEERKRREERETAPATP